MKETRTLQVRFAPNFGDLARAIGELIAADPPPEAEVTIALYERGGEIEVRIDDVNSTGEPV